MSMTEIELPSVLEDEEGFLAWAKSQVMKARNDRIPFEKQWYLNMSFFYGRQWVTWLGTGTSFDHARLYEPKRKAWQVRLTVNKVRPRVLRMVAKLNQEKPRGFVVPKTSDDEDIAAARAAEKVLEYVAIEQVKQDNVMVSVDLWAVLTGTAFVKDYFDSSQADPAGGIGIIRAEALSPFHIFVPDLELENIDDQPWVAHVATKNVEWVARTYGVELEARDSAATSILNDRFLHSLGINQNTAKDSAVVYEMWIKPGTTNQFPGGGKITWSQEKILDVTSAEATEDEEGNPVAPAFIHGHEYPFTRRIQTPTGRFYGDTPLTDMLPLQMEYNRGRSQIVEARNRTAKPQLLAQQGSVDPRQVTSEPGIIIQYKPGANPPQQLQLAQLPNYVVQDIQMSHGDMDELASQGEISRGDAPGRVEAATAIAYLQEEQDMIISLATDDKERAISRLGTHFLTYISHYWDSQRHLNVVGENLTFESFVFSKEAVRGNVNFRVEPGSARPLSRSAKQALIMDLLKQGAIPVGKGLRYLRMGDAARLWEEMEIDTRHAERQNVMMSQGVQSQVNDYDDDLVHIQIHDDHRKRQEYETLPEEVKQYFRVHVYKHLTQLAQKTGLYPQLSPQQMQQITSATQQDPNFVDPIMEMELRRVYEMVRLSGGQLLQPEVSSSSSEPTQSK